MKKISVCLSFSLCLWPWGLMADTLPTCPASDFACTPLTPIPEYGESGIDNDADGYFNDVDCDDLNVGVNPTNPEICDGLDNNCDTLIDNACVEAPSPAETNPIIPNDSAPALSSTEDAPPIISLPNGALVQTADDNLFIFLNDGLREFIHPNLAWQLGFFPENVTPMTPASIAGLPTGEPIVTGAEILDQIDPDLDELTSLIEIDYGTSPILWDTDCDSYNDKEEVTTRHDPLQPFQPKVVNQKLINRLKGEIVLQTERHGEAWYIHPDDGRRYYMRDGRLAYKIMRFLSLGILDKNLALIPFEDNLNTYVANSLVNRLKGRILLQVEQRGEAYYVTKRGKRIYLKDGAAAYDIMRRYGLGIKTSDLNQIPIGSNLCAR